METKPNLDNLEFESAESISNPNTLHCDLIRTLVENYRKNQLACINQNLGFDDAHSIHFDLATLKKFISDIENEALKNDSRVTDQDLGIRFYYAAYPKEQDWNIMSGTPIGTEYAQRHTLVLVPTMKQEDENGDKLCYDFNPLSASGSGEFLAMASARNSGLEGDIICQNHGLLNPPNALKVETF